MRSATSARRAPCPPRPYPFGVARLDDPSMQHFLSYYLTEGRSRAAGWSRAGRYRGMLSPILEEARHLSSCGSSRSSPPST